MHEYGVLLNPRVDNPLFASNANPLQLYHSPRVKILAFESLGMHIHNNLSLLKAQNAKFKLQGFTKRTL